MIRLSAKQRRLLGILAAHPDRGFDCAELAAQMDTSPQGVAQTAASLVRHGHVIRFVGGGVPQRTHYQLAETKR